MIAGAKMNATVATADNNVDMQIFITVALIMNSKRRKYDFFSTGKPD